MSQEEVDQEFVEIKVQLNVLMELLQESEEDQRCGWIMWNKMKWPKLQVKFGHRLNAQLKDEGTREAMMNVHYPELEEGPILSEAANERADEI